MWKQAADITPNDVDIVGELYLVWSIEDLRYLGIFSEEIRVYEILMDPDEVDIDGIDEEGDRIMERILEEYFNTISWIIFV